MFHSVQIMFGVKYCVLMAIKALLVSPSSLPPPRRCDHLNRVIKEGNIGVTSIFPWLGMLKVYIRQEGTIQIALTGMVLVKESFAIANADDVAKIPKRIFKEDSEAMFIPIDNKPWFCHLLDYITHPEYEHSTLNTIAIIELDLENENNFPVKPICWPPNSGNSMQDLYAIGFTDDNKVLEKSVYSLQYVDQGVCHKFYDSAGVSEANIDLRGLMESMMTPPQFQCGFAKNYQQNCIWDNGMVLASNSTRYWTLIGFGIRGPGCVAPARFIDMAAYLPWIESITNMDEINRPEYRKSAFNLGFRKTDRTHPPKADDEYQDVLYTEIQGYPFDTANAMNHYFTINRVSATGITILSLPGEQGNCSNKKYRLIYREETRVVSWADGKLEYRLSMFDLNYLHYSCTKINLIASQSGEAKLFYESRLDTAEGTAFHEWGDTPEDILKTYPIPTVQVPTMPPVNQNPLGLDKAHLQVKYQQMELYDSYQHNYNIFLHFQFEGEGMLVLEVRGRRRLRETTTETTARRRARPGRPDYGSLLARRLTEQYEGEPDRGDWIPDLHSYDD